MTPTRRPARWTSGLLAWAAPARAGSATDRTVRRRIAIACQGGGSQTAFPAGVLRGLLKAGVREQFDLVSLSGTSGGATCTALAR